MKASAYYSDASGAYQNAKRIKPEDAIVHNKLGIVYANLERGA